jgi:excisionase family DNA binding protein
MSRYVNVGEVARYTKLSVSTIKSHALKRRIPYMEIDGNLVFDLDAIDEWMKIQYHPMKDDSDIGCNRFITINEFCEEARISRTTFFRMRRKGRIPYTRIGNQVRIASQVLDDYAKEAGEGNQENSCTVQYGID